MTEMVNIAERKAIWIVLSEFYLDIELEESDFVQIARIIIESPYDLETVKEIDKHEVFPVLYPNLMSVAGEWTGFEKEWLITHIKDSLLERNFLRKVRIEISYLRFKWRFNDYWKKLEKVYDQLNEA